LGVPTLTYAIVTATFGHYAPAFQTITALHLVCLGRGVHPSRYKYKGEGKVNSEFFSSFGCCNMYKLCYHTLVNNMIKDVP